VLGGTSNAARDARMRQLIEDHIVKASTERTTPVIAEVNDPAQQESLRVLAVAPPRLPAGIAMGDTDASAADAKVEAIPVPRPRVLPAKPAATASKQVANTKAAPTRTRVIAKASTSGGLQTVYTLSSTRHVERKLAPSAP